MVQTVYNTFEEEGLDASKYNMWIADDVYSVDGSFYDSNNDSYNSKTSNAIHSVNYGLLYQELHAFIIAVQNIQLSELSNKIDMLTNRVNILEAK